MTNFKRLIVFVLISVVLTGCEFASEKAPPIKVNDESNITVDISNIVSNQNSISFDIVLTDESDTFISADLFLVDGDTVIDEEDIFVQTSNIEFGELLSNHSYKIVVDITYDLGDGNTTLESSYTTKTVSTNSKSIPVVTLSNIIEEFDSIGLDVNIEDPDSTYISSKVYLYDGQTIIDEFDLIVEDNSILFEDLDSLHQYTIKVKGIYDVDDGLEEQGITFKTSICLTLVNPDQEEIDVYIDFLNMTDNHDVPDLDVLSVQELKVLYEIEIASRINTVLPPFDYTGYNGFNLTNGYLFGDGSVGDANESSIQYMSDNGFMIARIPLDASKLLEEGSYTDFNENTLLHLDELVRYGEIYDVHILLDLHTLFDFGIIGDQTEGEDLTPEEKYIVWESIIKELTQRYISVPNNILSIELINEPFHMEREPYLSYVESLVTMVREIDVDRMLFIGNCEYNQGTPMYELVDLNDQYIVFAPHYYEPFQITHYNADWVTGADLYPYPVYPIIGFNKIIKGSYWGDQQQDLVIYGDFDENTIITINVGTVSSIANLQVSTTEEVLLNIEYIPDDNSEYWETVFYNETWNVYQNILNQDYILTITESTTEIVISNLNGDWLSVEEITISNPSYIEDLVVTYIDMGWDEGQKPLHVLVDGTIDASIDHYGYSKMFLYDKYIDDLVTFKEVTGIQIFCSEFGVHRLVPHDVMIKVIDDHVELMEENDIGWTLWNFIGWFGPISNGRDDVTYVDYSGYQMDVEMWEVLLNDD